MATVDCGRLREALLSRFTAGTDSKERDLDLDFLQFQKWALNVPVSAEPLIYCDLIWLSVFVGNRWSVISGIPVRPTTSGENAQMGSGLERTPSTKEIPTLDWTDEIPPSRLTAHASWARSLD